MGPCISGAVDMCCRIPESAPVDGGSVAWLISGPICRSRVCVSVLPRMKLTSPSSLSRGLVFLSRIIVTVVAMNNCRACIPHKQ